MHTAPDITTYFISWTSLRQDSGSYVLLFQKCQGIISLPVGSGLMHPSHRRIFNRVIPHHWGILEKGRGAHKLYSLALDIFAFVFFNAFLMEVCYTSYVNQYFLLISFYFLLVCLWFFSSSYTAIANTIDISLLSFLCSLVQHNCVASTSITSYV